MEKLKGALAVGFLRLFALLPWGAVQATGSAIGWLMWKLPNGSREVVRINLAKCFPELSAAERERLVGQTLRDIGKTLTESACAWIWPVERTLGLVREVEGLEVLQAALASGKGVVGVASHLGNWEVLNHFYCNQCKPIIFYRPPKLKAVDDLLRALLPVQPLAAMAQNLHWHYILPQTAGECAPILLDANTLAKGCALQPDAVYCLPLPRAAGLEGYYYARSMPTSLQLAQAAELFDAHPLVGVLGPALPLYAGCAAEKARRWQQQKPAVQAKLSALDCPLPLDETPPPLPNGSCLLVRGAAFPQGLPPLQTESDFWLVPLLAQYNGYASATFETAAQCAARADVLDAALAAQRGVGPVFRLMGRTVKNALRKRKESAR